MEFIFTENQLNLKEVVPPPEASKTTIPDWYKKIKLNKEQPNIKSCIPVLDAFISGYTQKTWADIEVVAGTPAPLISSDSPITLLSRRQHASIPVTNEYYNIEFLWVRHWIPLLPEGYSVLLTHPFNRLDLPFTTISAVIDLDTSSPHAIGKIPFYLKNNFTGTIPSGTPMFQMYPFRRENWKAVIKDFNSSLVASENEGIKSFDEPASYKSRQWHRKEYK